MKLRSHFFRSLISRFVLVGLTLGVIAAAALAATNAPAKAGPAAPKDAKTTAPEPPVTQSVFVIPSKAQEGKDPFFPRSTRPYGAVAPPKNSQPTVVAAELVLRGISGTAERPLAIINNYTFTAGEEREVTTGNTRLRIRCLEINMSAGAVLVQIGSERRELRLLKP